MKPAPKKRAFRVKMKKEANPGIRVVRSYQDQSDLYPKATVWDITTKGELVIYEGSRVIATYDRERWEVVAFLQ